MLELARGRIAGVTLTLCAAALPSVAGDRIRTPGEPPEVLARVGVTEGLSAFAISADGHLAALASESASKPDDTDLQLFSTAAPEPLTARLSGRVRDLLFATDGSVLYGILHRVSKRTGGDTHLVLIDPATLKMKRGNLLPLEATDLDHWITARALLIAAPAQIRTLLLPDLRSGPLFAVTGTNRAVASVGGGSLILVGQEDGLALIDLEDRPGQEQMPVREHLKTAGPVHGLAVATDGNSALARLADGSMYIVEFGPLRVRAAGIGSAVAAPPVVTAIPTAARLQWERAASTPGEPRREPGADRAPPAAGKPEAAPPPPEPVARPSAKPDSPPRTLPDERPPVPEAAPPRPRPDTRSVPDTAPPATPDDREAVPRLSGRITGEASAAVRFVVIQGPNNLLREAARVAPGPEGTWSVDGLAAGRYRIQLDAGGGRVLVSRPPFVIVEITDDEPRILTEPIEALRVL